MVDLLTKSPLVALRSEGKLHLVDLAGSECAKKGGLIYSEDIGRSGGGGSTSWRKIDGTWDISEISWYIGILVLNGIFNGILGYCISGISLYH